MTHDQMTHRDGRLSVAGVVLLAALGVPRAVLHDLHLLGTGPAAAILALAPPAIWLLVVLRRRISRPFRQLVLIGLTYGILLAASHQLLWGTRHGGAILPSWAAICGTSCRPRSSPSCCAARPRSAASPPARPSASWSARSPMRCDDARGTGRGDRDRAGGSVLLGRPDLPTTSDRTGGGRSNPGVAPDHLPMPAQHGLGRTPSTSTGPGEQPGQQRRSAPTGRARPAWPPSRALKVAGFGVRRRRPASQQPHPRHHPAEDRIGESRCHGGGLSWLQAVSPDQSLAQVHLGPARALTARPGGGSIDGPDR